MTKGKLIKIITPLCISGLLAAIVLILLKDHVQYKGIYDDVAAWSAFFSVFGIVYAIVAGFLLVTVLTKYSDLCLVIENELNAIETVRDFLTYLNDTNDKVKDNIIYFGSDFWLGINILAIQPKIHKITQYNYTFYTKTLYF